MGGAKSILTLSLFGLAMMWSPLFGTSEALLFPHLHSYPGETFASRVVCLAAYGLSMLAFSLAGERVRPRLRDRVVFVLMAVLGAMGMLLGALVGLETLPLGLLYVGAALRGICFTFLTVVWVDVYVRLEWKAAGLAVAAALMLYAAAGLAATALAQLASVLLVAVLPACPVLALWGNYRFEQGVVDGVDAGRAASGQRCGQVAPLRTRIALFAANFLFGVMLGSVLHHYAVSDTPEAIAAFLFAATILFVVIHSRREGAGFYGIYRAFAVCLAALVPVIVLFDWMSFEVAAVIISMVLAVMIFYAVIIFADAQVRLQNPYWKVPAMCQFFAAAGMVVSLAAFHRGFPDGMSAEGLVLVALACVVFVSGVFSPADHTQTRPWGFSSLIPSESEEIRRLRRCGELADSFKLTSRELEILQQLADGCTREEIASTLFISPATAKTHIRNIYAKLNVHSQKELIALLDLN